MRNRTLALRAAGDIVAYLKEVERALPRAGARHDRAGRSGRRETLMIEQLTRFAREVMPAFR